MHKNIRRILFVVSICFSILTLLFSLYAAVRIHPAFAFWGALDRARKLRLLKTSALLTVAAAVCLILLTADELPGDKKGIKLRFSTLAAMSAAAAAPLVSLILFYAQSGSPGSYQSAALGFYLYPLAIIRIITDLASVKGKRPLIGIAFPAVMTALTAPAALLCGYWAFYGLTALVFAIMYLALPVSIMLLSAASAGYENGRLSKRTFILFCAEAAVMPLCNIIMPYNTQTAAQAGGIAFALLFAVCAASEIIDFMRYARTNREKITDTGKDE